MALRSASTAIAWCKPGFTSLRHNAPQQLHSTRRAQAEHALQRVQRCAAQRCRDWPRPATAGRRSSKETPPPRCSNGAPTTTAVDAPRRSRPVLAARQLTGGGAAARWCSIGWRCAPAKGLKNEHVGLRPRGAREGFVVGSCCRGSASKERRRWTLASNSPDALITTKDLANGRYLAKRCAYLEQCAEVLRGRV